MDKKISVSQIKEVAQEAYEMFKTNTGGKNADQYCQKSVISGITAGRRYKEHRK